MECIFDARDNKLTAEITACDLSKAFDCVSHNILLKKLQYYGIRGNAYNILKSYLENRKQTVWWQNNYSAQRAVEVGVPQGSILGPLLFIIYINDLPNNIANSKTCIYADDTSILVKGMGKDVQCKRTNALKSAENWFKTNKLKLNAEKTKSLTIGDKQEETINLLGINVDGGLTWRSHIDMLCIKLSRAIYSIRVMRQVSTQQAAKLTYYANFHSIASYGVTIWGRSSDFERVLILQKKALRTLCGMRNSESCRETFKRERILTIASVYILSCVKYVHTNQMRFTRNEEFHQYDTRNRKYFVVPHHRLCMTQRGVDYWGVKMYNHLPAEVKALNKTRFKKRVRELLLKNTIYNMNEYFSTMF